MYVLCAFVILNKDYLLTYLLKGISYSAACGFRQNIVRFTGRLYKLSSIDDRSQTDCVVKSALLTPTLPLDL